MAARRGRARCSPDAPFGATHTLGRLPQAHGRGARAARVTGVVPSGGGRVVSELGESRAIRLVVNGRTIEREVPVRRLLADFLRDDLGLVATRLGCEHGVCGACT